MSSGPDVGNGRLLCEGAGLSIPCKLGAAVFRRPAALALRGLDCCLLVAVFTYRGSFSLRSSVISKGLEGG